MDAVKTHARNWGKTEAVRAARTDADRIREAWESVRNRSFAGRKEIKAPEVVSAIEWLRAEGDMRNNSSVCHYITFRREVIDTVTDGHHERIVGSLRDTEIVVAGGPFRDGR